MSETCNWQGKSGKVYAYAVYKLEGAWNAHPGNYIFARHEGGVIRAVYIGQTNSFANRLPCHEKIPCAVRHGFTHVHAHVNQSEAARLFEEADLIAYYQPTCNVQVAGALM